MRIKPLNCYCDHCASNTCSTTRICYAEWRAVTKGNNDNNDNFLKQLRQSNSFSSTALPPPPLIGADSSISAGPSSSFSPRFSTPQPFTERELQATNQPISPQWTQLVPEFELEKHYNCFEKDDPLILETICNGTAATTSHVIRRCCRSGDYCNKDTNLLPTEQEARKVFADILTPPHDFPSKPHSFLHMLWNGFLTLPLGLQVASVLFTLLLLLYVLALAHNGTLDGRRRRRQRNAHGSPNQDGNPFKRLLDRIMSSFRRRSPDTDNYNYRDFRHNQRRRSQGLGETQSLGGGRRGQFLQTVHHIPGQAPIVPSPPADGVPAAEDFSEHSVTRASYDSNSMASREPLIEKKKKQAKQATEAKQVKKVQTSQDPDGPPPLDQPHKSPFMTEVTYNGIAASSFQMTLGSAAGSQFEEDSSGSGAGQPYLTQRSISHDIELCDVIGRGYFGVVWRGKYKGEAVAVKIFSPAAEPSWERETEIYQTTMLRHRNILGYIASDKRHDAALTGFWLVTDYYALGSLYDFLVKNTMSMADAVRMAFSIANGLSHLHMEIFGTRGKPALAHRDLKSKNILVKNDGSCCIADLGMAVRYSSANGIVDVPTNTRIGTRRYLAPEVLENKLNLMDFEAVKATDIYALGLVLWEIIRRSCMLQRELDQYGYAKQPPPGPPANPPLAREDRPAYGSTGSGALPGSRDDLAQPDVDFRPQSDAPEAGRGPPLPGPSQHIQLVQVQQQPPEQIGQLSVSISHLQQSPHIQQQAAQGPQQPLQQPIQPGQPQLVQPQQPQFVQPQQAGLRLEQPPQSGPGLGQPQQAELQQAQVRQEQPQQNRGEPQGAQPQAQGQPELRPPPHHMSFMTAESLDTTIDDLNSEFAIMCEAYEAPYQNYLPSDPTAEEMRRVVCVAKVRPPISPRWSKFAAMRDYVYLMTECWYEKPQSRLSALRVRKSLSDVAQKYFNLNMEYD